MNESTIVVRLPIGAVVSGVPWFVPGTDGSGEDDAAVVVAVVRVLRWLLDGVLGVVGVAVVISVDGVGADAVDEPELDCGEAVVVVAVVVVVVVVAGVMRRLLDGVLGVRAAGVRIMDGVGADRADAVDGDVADAATADWEPAVGGSVVLLGPA
jgi:hypothetical protein